MATEFLDTHLKVPGSFLADGGSVRGQNCRDYGSGASPENILATGESRAPQQSPNAPHQSTQAQNNHECATVPTAAGATLRTMVPFVLVQDPFNAAQSLYCSRCGASCASADLLIDFLSHKLSRAEAVELLKSQGDAWTASATSLASTTASVQRVQPVACSCGTLYCSRACCTADGECGHKLLCVGDIDDEAHPLYQFKLFAIQSGNFEVLQATATIFAFFVAAAIKAAPGSDGAATFAAILAHFDPLFVSSNKVPQVPLSEPILVKGEAEQVPVDDNVVAAQELLQTAYELLRDGFLQEHSIVFGSTEAQGSYGPERHVPVKTNGGSKGIKSDTILGGALSFEFFSRVFWDLTQFGTNVEIVSPIVSHCESLLTSPEAHLERELDRLRYLGHVLDEVNREFDTDEEESVQTPAGGGAADNPAAHADPEQHGEQDVGGIVHKDDDRSDTEPVNVDWDALTVDDFVCDAKKIFTRAGDFDGLALFLPVARLRHSCNPTVAVSAKVSDDARSSVENSTTARNVDLQSVSSSAMSSVGGAAVATLPPFRRGLVGTLVATSDIGADVELTAYVLLVV